jgi:hypothetical protein
MAKKQVIATEGGAAAAPARAATPKTTSPRVRTVKHSKTIAAEAPIAAESAVAAEPGITHIDSVPAHDTPQMHVDHVVDHHAAISRLAYSYWEARGYQGGSQDDDWLRAEREYRQSFEL